MSEIVNDAAQILLPLLAAGSTAAVEEASKEAGKEVVGKIRKFLHRPNPTKQELATALQQGVDEGTITEKDLGEIVRLYTNEGSGTQVNVEEAGSVHVHSTFNGPVTF